MQSGQRGKTYGKGLRRRSKFALICHTTALQPSIYDDHVDNFDVSEHTIKPSWAVQESVVK